MKEIIPTCIENGKDKIWLIWNSFYILHKRKSISYVQCNQRRSLDAYFNISYLKEEVQVTLCNLHLASYSPFWHIILTQASVLLYLLNVLWSTWELVHKWEKVSYYFICFYCITMSFTAAKNLFSFRILPG